MNKSALLEHLAKLSPSAGLTVVFAIDGCGGAGKSTLAATLASLLPGSMIVPTDDFASWEEPIEWWPRLVSDVLRPLAEGRPARYQRYDWVSRSRQEWRNVDAPLGLLEGVSSTRTEFRPYLAYRIWVDCPPEIRLLRGLKRDGDAMEAQWRQWMTEEDRYVQKHKPRESADVTCPGSD